MPARPSFIFLIADDHRHESIGASGCREVRTPALDRLAATGTSFDGAHCQGGMHPAVCVPSRATLMTGRNIFASSERPDALDYRGGGREGRSHVIPAGLPTFPQLLREAGYRTHAVGKWHNDRAAFARSFGSAERVFFGGMSDHDRVPLHDFDPAGAYDAAPRFEAGLSTDLFRQSAVDFLRAADPSEPFCLYVAFTAPHDPRTPPDRFRVDPEALPLPENFLPAHPFDNGEALVRDELLEAFPRTPEAVRGHLADYYGMIGHLDAAVGAILDVAAERDLTENTVVVYTADHGLALGQHGLLGKQNLYEHSLHVPLMIAGPGIPAGRRIPALVWHADTRATVLGLAGIDPGADSEGETLLPLALGRTTELRTHFAFAYRMTQRAIRDDRHKLIRYFERARVPATEDQGEGRPTPGSSTSQLFDLAADPHERVNLAWVPEMQAIRQRLEAELVAWQRRVGDPLLDYL
jgi:arylsulfatase A-like enzyme